MGHDEHFLQRLDRVKRDHVEIALGMYRDHEFVKYLLSHVKLPPAAERVALALDDGGEGPHLVVARDGGFVTCLGKGMKTGGLPIVSRARIEGIATKIERVREGMALARRRGLDVTRAVSKMESAGPGLSREDFIATAALLGPATTVLTETYATCARSVHEALPLLTSRGGDGVLRRELTREVASMAWGMAHSALMHVDNASREWVKEWAELPAHARASPWTVMSMTGAVPFVARAAWIAARLGKPLLPAYKARFARGGAPFEFLDAGWGLVAMALRHSSLRAEAIRALQAPPAPDGNDDVLTKPMRELFGLVAETVGRDDEQRSVEMARTVGRDVVVVRTSHLAEGSPHRYREAAAVPDELALAAFLEAPFDALDDNGLQTTVAAVFACARAGAEQLYMPATFLRAVAPISLDEWGSRLVELRRNVIVTRETVRREAPRVGRNEPCPCGSGKKHKRCCAR